MGGRSWLVGVMLALLLFDFCGGMAVLICTAAACPEEPSVVEFIQKPHDRPLLGTVQQVWEARTTGISRFHFDGVYYIIDDLPKEYIDYSSWSVRMP